jgi:hypothetical protein
MAFSRRVFFRSSWVYCSGLGGRIILGTKNDGTCERAEPPFTE